jgi:hypothetical protein
MPIAAWIIVAVFVVATTVFVIGLFIWAAVKDGQEDRALQKRLGIRRKTGWAVRRLWRNGGWATEHRSARPS